MKEKIAEETSMNIGLSASIVLLLASIKDILEWCCNVKGYHLNGIIGMVAICSCLIILKYNLSEKIKKKKEKIKQFIDLCTLISIVVFTLENAAFDYVQDGEKILITIILWVLTALPLIFLISIFFKKEK